MILTDAREVIYEAFLTGWAAAQPSVPVATDNDAFTPPDDGSAWVRLAVRVNSTLQESMASDNQATIRTFGSIFVQVFTPRDAGVSASDALVTSVKALLQRQTLVHGSVIGNANQLMTYATTAREVGNDGPWFQVNAVTPFMFDEIG